MGQNCSDLLQKGAKHKGNCSKIGASGEYFALKRGASDECFIEKRGQAPPYRCFI